MPGSVKGNLAARVNPHLHENLLVQIQTQIEAWNREAVRHPNPEAAHRLWQKAEGLQYALRVLYAFQPEFNDLVEAALKGGPDGPVPLGSQSR